MKPEIQFRRTSGGLYEAFHILEKSNGKKMKIYETATSMQGAAKKLKSLIAPLYERETAYKICK